MRDAESKMVISLWMDAARRRWSLRRAAGESRWQLALQMASWVWLSARQTQWLRSLHASETMRRAAHADPRLYERWHRPYISTHFDIDARRRIVNAHYAFVMQHLPAWLAERIVLGGGARVASIRLNDGSEAHLHLRKPSRGDAGELILLLLTADRDVLASCILTFDQHDSVIIGALRGAGPHTPLPATRAFIRGSHGLQPKELLLLLVRELAALHGLKRIRAVASSACVTRSSQGLVANGADAFWREQGGAPGPAGCHELPLSLVRAPCAEGPHSRREKRQQKEAFCRDACAAFVAALRRTASPHSACVMTSSVRDGAATLHGRSHGLPKPAAASAGLLAAGL